MKKGILGILCTTLTLFIGSICCANANIGYTESIRMNGNDVEYNYVEDEKPVQQQEIKNDSNKNTPYYFSVTPYNNYWPAYQQGYWGHYPSTHYNSHYYYGNSPKVYTYSATGIKTGPDGRVITPLMERDMYSTYNYPYRPSHHYGGGGYHGGHRPHGPHRPHHRF